MNRNKVFKWLYGVFMFLPLLAIGVTCAYVTFNKNAKDSYSGNNTYEYVAVDEIVLNNRYTLNTTNLQNIQGGSSGRVYYNNISNIQSNNITLNTELADNQYVSFNIYTSNSNKIIYLYDVNGNASSSMSFNNTTLIFDFTIESFSTVTSEYDFLKSVLFTENTQDNYYLDNAFYYAVDKFNESGFNQIDFVSFFDFLYESPNIWTTFANCYINYSMFVTLCFFLPSVLLWFVNFSYKLVDGFSNKVMR